MSLTLLEGAVCNHEFFLQSSLRAFRSSQHDEGISGDDLSQCLRALMGTDDVSTLSKRLGAKEFAEDVLGFDDYTAQQSK